MSQAKEPRAVTEEQEGDTDVETALAVLNEDDGTNLEETDVQEILLAHKESRQLRRLNNKGIDLTYTLSHLSRERTLGT